MGESECGVRLVITVRTKKCDSSVRVGGGGGSEYVGVNLGTGK